VDSTDGGVVLAHGTTAKTALIFLKVACAGPFVPDGGESGGGIASPTAAPASASGETAVAAALVASSLTTTSSRAANPPEWLNQRQDQLSSYAQHVLDSELAQARGLLKAVEVLADDWDCDVVLWELLLASREG
jgi:hypothetical protein